MIRFKGKNLAKGLESALFICPSCKKIGELKSDTDRFFCSCGMNTVYNEYGFFKDGRPFNNYTDWYDWQSDELKKRVEDTYTRFSVSDGFLQIKKIENSHKREVLPYSNIKMNPKQFIMYNEKGEKLVIDNNNITGISIYSRNNLLVNTKQDYYELKPDKKHNCNFNARKYLHLYEIVKKEHRKE